LAFERARSDEQAPAASAIETDRVMSIGIRLVTVHLCDGPLQELRQVQQPAER
jgi:hypothetical protein